MKSLIKAVKGDASARFKSGKKSRCLTWTRCLAPAFPAGWVEQQSLGAQLDGGLAVGAGVEAVAECCVLVFTVSESFAALLASCNREGIVYP